MCAHSIGRECSQQNWSDTTKQGSGAICPHLRQGGGEAGREGGREGGRESETGRERVRQGGREEGKKE